MSDMSDDFREHCLESNTMHLVACKWNHHGVHCINPFDAVAGMDWGKENWGNTIAADALASCNIRSSAAIILTLWSENVLVFLHIRGILNSLWHCNTIQGMNFFFLYPKWLEMHGCMLSTVAIDVLARTSVSPMLTLRLNSHCIGQVSYTEILQLWGMMNDS